MKLAIDLGIHFPFINQISNFLKGSDYIKASRGCASR